MKSAILCLAIVACTSAPASAIGHLFGDCGIGCGLASKHIRMEIMPKIKSTLLSDSSPVVRKYTRPVAGKFREILSRRPLRGLVRKLLRLPASKNGK